MSYFDEWEESVQACNNMTSKKEKGRAMLAKETRVGLFFTGIKKRKNL
ncbi:hypothetical protein SPONN_2328 [uncultured Candidatus Thioglobus sp.]|nr:hypothetical protein SPONN_2328 [uncultured Candidatus Thioglobus sp.]